jgi:Calcineurin-like phosphoesterase
MPPRNTRRTRRTPGVSAHPVTREVAGPVWAQPMPTEDPKTFVVKHASDSLAYKEIDELNREHKIHPLPFPAPRGGVEPKLTLEQVLNGSAIVQEITKSGQIVFHGGGDCGSTRGPKTQNLVTDKLVSDFDEHIRKEVPQFCLLLGDIVYSFGEAQYYYDQFYEPYRNYPAPILAVAGNHDGMVSPETHVASLEAFLRNFCAEKFEISPDAVTLSRTAQIQPGVFFTFEAPFVRILAIYSNMLEDPGVIADGNIGNSQLKFLRAALKRVKTEQYEGAVIIANHHPPYVGSGVGHGRHGGSPDMLAQIDEICAEVGVWPHAFLSGHAHNYQRFTRTLTNGTEIPYVVCGNMGHNAQRLTRGNVPPPRVPQIIEKAKGHTNKVVFERYDADYDHYGYLRVVVTASQLRIEYHPASDGAHAKTPDDSVTVDLKTHKRTSFRPNDHGWSERARHFRELRER